MARDDKERFRITAWPNEPLPTPKVWLDRDRYFFLPSGGIFLDVTEEPELREVDLQDLEIYLELVALDLENPDDILKFINTYGPLGIRRGEPVHSWGPEPKPYAGVMYFGFRQFMMGHLEESVEAALAEIRSVMPDFEFEVERETDDEDFFPETLTEFRYGATWLRDLVAAWRWLSEDELPIDWECQIWRDNDELDGPPDTKSAAAFFLSHGLDLALSPFQPRVFVPVPQEVQQERLSPSQPFSQGIPTFFLCCLELFNHIAAQASYKHCSNEPCQRLFVKQIGRSMHGQHRSRGVKYCSAECAKAQAQREYRRRKVRAATHKAGGSERGAKATPASS